MTGAAPAPCTVAPVAARAPRATLTPPPILRKSRLDTPPVVPARPAEPAVIVRPPSAPIVQRSRHVVQPTLGRYSRRRGACPRMRVGGCRLAGGLRRGGARGDACQRFPVAEWTGAGGHRPSGRFP